MYILLTKTFFYHTDFYTYIYYLLFYPIEPKMMDAILHLQGACMLKKLPLPTLQTYAIFSFLWIFPVARTKGQG